jgi:uncharacterized membrane protein YozB (DUF420 family)
MGTAFVTSCIFLVTYVAHKILMKGVHTPFPGEGFWRPVYYTMLFTHIVLAIVVPPLAIVTMRHALAGRYEAHRRLSKWTFPIWLYVSVTGVLVYFFLYRWFRQHGSDTRISRVGRRKTLPDLHRSLPQG